ncbi:MAG: hypothetical protein MI867_00120, partial [Pseudomonadales bacterium]|nr:hypothetical protein [Pseudomonadales bacterium]
LDDGSFCGRIQWRHGGCTFSTMKDLVKDGELIHLAFSVLGNNMRLYKNGVLIGAGSGNCCHRFVGSIWLGGNGFGRSSYFGELDEVQYHDRALTDEEISTLYSELIIADPNPELEAELASAYEEISNLQQQITELSDTNTNLEIEIAVLEEQETITASQIFSLETQIDDLENQVDQLENQVNELEVKVASLDEYIAILQEQINELKQLVSGLESQVTQLESRVSELQVELNALKQLLSLSLERIEADFRETFNDPDFEIPGDTPEEEIENLVTAIIGLSKKEKIGLYEGLGGVYYQYQAYKNCSHEKYYSKYKNYDKYNKYKKYKKHHGYWSYKNYGKFVSYGKSKHYKYSKWAWGY